MDEMDPTLTVLELARDVAQQKYLHSLEDSITNVEFSAHLTALNDKSEMSEVDDSCPHQEDLERGSTATPPQTAHKRQRAALARFVKKIKQRAEAASARAGALPVLQLGADINPAQEGWRTWNKDSQDTNTVGDKDRVGSKTSTCSAQLIDLPTWLDHRQDRTYEYKELGYSATVSSFTRSRHREQRFAQNNEAEYKKPTNSERRSAERTRREFRLKEDEEECYMLFKKFDSSTTRRALEDYKSGSRSTEEEKLNKLRAAMPKSKIIVSKDDMERFFIVDSGTTVSIVSDLSALDDVNLSHIVKIMGFNSSVSRSKGRGSTFGFARSADGRRVVPLKIPNVHHLPGAPHDLLSVSAMTACGYKFNFKEEDSYIVTPDGDRLELLHKKGLYWLKWRRAVDPNAKRPGVVSKDKATAKSSTLLRKKATRRGAVAAQRAHVDHREAPVPSDNASFLNGIGKDTNVIPPGLSSPCTHPRCAKCNLSRAGGPKTPLMLLHRRLGHWNTELIEKMVKNRAIDVMLSDRARCVCDVCRVSKPTRRHVPRDRGDLADQTKPFQRVWTDLKGKVMRDFFGNQHIVTFTCEVTRWTCVYFVKNKSDTKKVYKEFIQWVKLQGYKVEFLNSDGGGEYTANENAKIISEFQQISIANGINQKFTSAHTPEMNGVSERLNRTIVEHTRALLLEAGLSREFWSLAVKHVVYVRNRLWHPHLTNSLNVGSSPYQLVYGKVPRLSTTRVWGCDAWKLDHMHKSGSFGRKAKKMIYVGISPNRKGWVLFDPASRKTSTTYHCTFDEDMSNRRCALRDYDLRRHKAGPSATADDERLAKLERSLYDDSPIINYNEPPNGAEEAYLGPRSSARGNDNMTRGSVLGPLSPKSSAGGNDKSKPKTRSVRFQQPVGTPQRVPRESGARGDHHQHEDERATARVQQRSATRSVHQQEGSTPPTSSSRREGQPDRQISGSSGMRSVDQLSVPERRAAIGSPQEVTEEEQEFLQTALEMNLPMVMQQRNPKRAQSVSRQRYEKYKSGKTLREVKNLGAKWEDVVWDYARGYIDFSPTTASNANLAELVEQWENRGIESSPAAYVNSEGIVNTSSPCSFMSFEESIQQDYAQMALEHIESLTHRAQRVLQKGLNNQTLEQFAHCCASRIMVPEPLTVKQAMASEHAAEWKKAMQEEIDTLTRFNTFKVVTREDAIKHGKLVKSKWVFKVKHDSDGSIQRFKARLVAKGFTQVPGTDFYDTYSPVFSYTSLRSIMAMAVERDFQLDQWDLKSSFVQQKLDVDHMYMESPDGYDKFLPDGRRTALHCLQSLYGLKQSSRLLHERLSKFLIKLGFKQLISDRCVFTKGSGNDQIIVATWVDDIIMASAPSNKDMRIDFDKKIGAEFEMSPWTSGQADWILNMNVTRDWKKGRLHLSQPKAIEKLAERFGLSDGKRKPHVPMNPVLKLNKPSDNEIIASSVFDYPSAVGGLLYLSLTARPDVAQSVSVLSRFMSCPGQPHVDAAKQIIAYLHATKDYGITYTKGKGGSPHVGSLDGPSLQAFIHARKGSTAIDDVMGDSRLMGTYCDADLAGDEGTRKSTSGFCMLINGGLVCWSSRLQATVALSTAEAETIAATEAVKQLMHLRLFLRELGQEQAEPSVVYEDNNAAISLAHGKEQSKRAKHYQLKVHFLNEQFKHGTFSFEKVATKMQLADAFTKALPREDFNRYREWMGVTLPTSDKILPEGKESVGAKQTTTKKGHLSSSGTR